MRSLRKRRGTRCCFFIPIRPAIVLILFFESLWCLCLLATTIGCKLASAAQLREIDLYDFDRSVMFNSCLILALISLISVVFWHSNLIFLISYIIQTGGWCVASCIFLFSTIDDYIVTFASDEEEVDDDLWKMSLVAILCTLPRVYFTHVIYKFIRIKSAKVRHVYDANLFVKHNASDPIKSKTNINPPKSEPITREGNSTIPSIKNNKSIRMTLGEDDQMFSDQQIGATTCNRNSMRNNKSLMMTIEGKEMERPNDEISDELFENQQLATDGNRTMSSMHNMRSMKMTVGNHEMERKEDDDLFAEHQTSVADGNRTVQSQIRDKKSLRMTIGSEKMESKEHGNYGIQRMRKKSSDELFSVSENRINTMNTNTRSMKNRQSLTMTLRQENDSASHKIEEQLSNDLFAEGMEDDDITFTMSSK
eukprot:136701_1